MEAARALADFTTTNLTEYVVAERFNSDRPEAGLNLGLMYMAQHRYADAERELRASLKVDPRYVPAFVNLAELYRATGHHAEADRALRDAVRLDSSNAKGAQTLRTVIVRRKKVAEALSQLVSQRLQRRDKAGALVYARRLASLEPGNPDVQALVQRLSAGIDPVILPPLVDYRRSVSRGDADNCRARGERPSGSRSSQQRTAPLHPQPEMLFMVRRRDRCAGLRAAAGRGDRTVSRSYPPRLRVKHVAGRS